MVDPAIPAKCLNVCGLMLDNVTYSIVKVQDLVLEIRVRIYVKNTAIFKNILLIQFFLLDALLSTGIAINRAVR